MDGVFVGCVSTLEEQVDYGYSSFAARRANTNRISLATIRPRPAVTSDCAQWALDKPDGTAVSLVAESVLEISDSAAIIGDGWTLAAPTIRLLDRADIQQWNTVDVQGVLTTPADDSRAILPSGVQLHADSRGKPFTCPTPPVRGIWSAISGDWARKVEVLVR